MSSGIASRPWLYLMTKTDLFICPWIVQATLGLARLKIIKRDEVVKLNGFRILSHDMLLPSSNEFGS